MSEPALNEVKTSILQRAMDMFQRYGLRAMTMDDVCRELSMSKKTLYQYFSNKADLVDQAVRHVFCAHQKSMDQLGAEHENAIDRMINFFPEERRAQLLMDLSLNLKAMISQRLIPRADGQGATRLRDLLDAAAGLVRRRSTVFVVSDFISEPGWDAALARLARRHEVVAVRLFDPIELELPDLGLLTLRDAETGEQLLVDTHDKGFRRRFVRIAAQREAQLREGLAAAGVDTLELATDDDLVDALVRFVDLRRRRTRLSGGSLPSHLSQPPSSQPSGASAAAA